MSRTYKPLPAALPWTLAAVVAGGCLLSPLPSGAIGSISAGTGVFVAADKALYMDVGADLYPETGGALEFSVIRLGLKAGLIYRKIDIWGSSYYGSYYDSFTRAFLPLQAELLVAPLADGKELPTFSPYFGGMTGAFISIGDDSESIPAFSVKGGADLNLGPFFTYGDLRYTHAPRAGTTLVVS